MVALTYKVQIDWDDNGTWTDANEDVTADVWALDWRRGRSQPHHLAARVRPGAARITVNNSDGKYSTLNTSSPLTGNLKPGRKVRIRTQSSGAEATRWQGFVQNITPHVTAGGFSTVTLSCVGALGYIAERDVEVAMQTTIRVDEAIDLILDAIGWPKHYADEIAADAPTGYWRLGESSGNALDTSGNGNDGTVTGATQGETGLLGDDTNGSYEFDGASGDVTVSDDSAIQNIFDGGGTWEAWINADSDGEGNNGHVIWKDNGNVMHVFGESGGAMRLRLYAGFGTTAGLFDTTGSPLTVGQTHYIAVTYDSASTSNVPTIYIDGAAVAVTVTQTPVGSAPNDVGGALAIGNRTADDSTFDGHIDEVALYTTVLTADRIKAHYLAGVQRWRDLDTAKTTMNRWWVNRMKVPIALRILEETEGGIIYETKDGKIAFRHHHDRFANRTSQATFSDAAGATLRYQAISQADPDRGIYNILETDVRFFTVGSEAVLWAYPDSTAPMLAVGETKDFWARYPVADSPNEDVGVDAWTTPVENTDYDANSREAGGGTDLSGSLGVSTEKYGGSMKMSITDNHASLPAYLVDSGGTIKLQARGTPVSESDPLTVRQEDETSKRDHGERSYSTRDAWMPNYENADSWARVNLDLYKDPSPTISIGVLGNRSQAHLDEVEDRDINDRITVRADAAAPGAVLGFNQDWFVEAEHHRVTRERVHTVTWDLSDPSGYDLYWQLDVSALDTETKLGR